MNSDFSRSPFPPQLEGERPQLRLTRADLPIFSPFSITALILVMGIAFPAVDTHQPSAPWADTVIGLLILSHLPLASFLIFREKPGVRVFALLVSIVATGTSLFAGFWSSCSIMGEYI